MLFADRGAASAAVQTVNLSLLPKVKRDEAIRRAGILAELERYCGQAVRRGFYPSQALADFAAERGIAERTLKRWRSRFKNEGIMGLVDMRGGGPDGSITITPSAWLKFQQLFLQPNRRSVRQCRDDVIGHASMNELGWQVPSLRRMQQMANECISYPRRVLAREGKDAYEAKCAPYIIKDITTVPPGMVWVGDHHQFNCWIWHRNDWYRPWITAWLDMRSRKVVGRHVNVGPNQATVLAAFADGARTVGIPESVKIDNGKDYDSEMWTGMTKLARKRILKAGYIEEDRVRGLYAMMNITVSFAIPYNAKAKSIERWFKTMDTQFTNTLPTYTGYSVATRPDDIFEYLKTDKAKRDALSLEAFTKLIDRYIEIYNASEHTGDGMDGRSPDEVFNLRTAKRSIDADSLMLLCAVWSRRMKVGKNGVRVKGLWYGYCDPALSAHQGKEVYCSYDPMDMSSVRVYDVNYNYLCTAEMAEAVGYGHDIYESDVRAANRKIRHAKKIVRDSIPAARTAGLSVAHASLEAAKQRTRPAPPAATPAIRPVATPLDGQASKVKRTERMKQVRRAAGAEGTTQVPDLIFDEVDMDSPSFGPLEFDDERPTNLKYERLEFDDV